MNRFFTKFLILLMLVFSASCQAVMEAGGKFGERLYKPWPWGLVKLEEIEGSELYKKGWKEGCESGLAVYGNHRYKAFYTVYQDVEHLHDKDYYKAWKDSYSYCRWYVYHWARGWHM